MSTIIFLHVLLCSAYGSVFTEQPTSVCFITSDTFGGVHLLG